MKIFQTIDSFFTSKKTIVTIGTFDGVHIGHQKIIEKLIENAKANACESLILTFFPHPRMVLQAETDIRLLHTIEERIDHLKKTGLDNLIIHPFDETFSRLSAEDFVKNVLVDQLKIKKIVIGYDHRFGRNRKADINDLIEFGAKYDFEVQQITAQEINAVSVSSSKIRVALANGNIKLANKYLGGPFILTGTVQSGKKLGRTIGFPTANLKIAENYKLIPKIGVYIVSSILNGFEVYGMMNIGYKPTVGGTSLSIEIYFLDFEGDLYNQKIQVSVLEYIREEQKFESLIALQDQLQKDKNTAITYRNMH